MKGPPPSHPVMGLHTQHQSRDQSLDDMNLQANSQLPGVDMAALHGVSEKQILAIARLFQTGAIPLPSQQDVAPRAFGLEIDSSPPFSKLIDAAEIEEEGEIPQKPTPRDFLRPPPTGPRNRSKSPRSKIPNGGSIRTSSPRRPHNNNPLPVRNDQTSAAAPTSPSHLSVSREGRDMSTQGGSKVAPEQRLQASKAFITELHNEGFTFDQLAKELQNELLLKSMYNQLGLLNMNSIGGTDMGGVQRMHDSSRELSLKPTKPKKPPPPKPAVPLDRSAYLAKLQAAKNKKTETTKPLPAETLDPVIKAPHVPPDSPTVTATANGSITQTPAANKISAKNELIRARLEALKAKQAVRPAKSSNLPTTVDAITYETHSTGSSESAKRREDNGVTHNGSHGHFENSTDSATPAVTVSGNPPPLHDMPSSSMATVITPLAAHFHPLPRQATNFTGLPGLFMTNSSSDPTASTAPLTSTGSPDTSAHANARTSDTAHNPNAVAGSRPLDHGVELPSSVASATQNINPHESTLRVRPFGHRNHDVDESIIITNSDDEGDDDVYDIYELGASDNGQNSASHSNGQTPLSSSVHVTPQPGSDLKRKLEEIEQAKRLLAEAQKRKKTTNHEAKVPSATQTYGAHIVANGLSSSSSASDQDVLSMGSDPHYGELATAVPGAAAELPTSAKSSAIAKEKERLRRRLEELRNSRSTSLTPSALPKTLDLQREPFSSANLETSGTQDSPRAASVGSASQRLHSPPGGTFELNPALQANSRSPIPVSEPTSRVGTTVLSPSVSPPNSNSEDQILHYGHEEQNPHEMNDMMLSDAPVAIANPDAADIEYTMPDPDNAAEYTEDDVAMDVSDSETESTESHPIPRTGPSSTSSSPVGTQIDQIPADDQSLVAATEDLPAQPTHESITSAEVPHVETKSHFKPYESPLARFKDFRYHTQFLQSVPGGHKSLTYSHDIDAENTLCPYEGAAGICNDKACQHQHFKSMMLSDNDLLRLMGTKNMPVSTPDQEKLWKDGLGAVIKQLRTTNVGKDVSAIAQRIAEYRRDFMDDPSKVLRLD